MCGAAERMRLVAVASSDGRNIDRHLGQSDEFLIYEVARSGAHRLVERRHTGGRADPHAPDGLAAVLQGVEIVLARRAGPGAMRALNASGVHVFAVGGDVDNALEAIARRGWLLEAPPLATAPGASCCGPAEGEQPAGCDPSACDPSACGPSGGAPSGSGCGGCR